MERQLSVSSESTIKDGQSKMDGTEYIPARCRITKPNPPKPAKNPLQFVKIGPCDLYKSAQEQIKKVEVIKKFKQDLKDDAQDWQLNLDSWKNSRRKRQEHIIERVVEIKNMKQEEDKSRRRSKTYSEMMEERSTRKRFNVLPTYAANDNDLSELGISVCNKNNDTSDDSTSEDMLNMHCSNTNWQPEKSNCMYNKTALQMEKTSNDLLTSKDECNENRCDDENITSAKSEYTYESAIQGYKTRVKQHSYHEPLTNDLNTYFEKDKNDRRLSLYTFDAFDRSSELSTSTPSLSTKTNLPKIDILRRKRLFETGDTMKISPKVKDSKPIELCQSSIVKDRRKDFEESMEIKKTARRLSGDIMSVRERLSGCYLVCQNSDDLKNNMSAWASTGQLQRTVDVYDQLAGSDIEEKNQTNKFVKHQYSASKSEDTKNGLEYFKLPRPSKNEGNRTNNIYDKKNLRINQNLTESLRASLSKLDNSNKVIITPKEIDVKDNTEEIPSNIFSPVYEKPRTFHHSLDNLHAHENRTERCILEHVQSLDALDCCGRNYPPSGSSTELLALSQCGDTDREDSGIQTADVSCSVSQADEPEDDSDILTTVNNSNSDRCLPVTSGLEENQDDLPVRTYLNGTGLPFYHDSKSTDSLDNKKDTKGINDESSLEIDDDKDFFSPKIESMTNENVFSISNSETENTSVIEEPTVVLFDTQSDIILDPLAPAKSMEPPKEKPPPPPSDVLSDEELIKPEMRSEFKRLNSTKRIKNDLRNKRSSFLGIEGLTDDYLSQELLVAKPPNANTILQEELQLEKQLYRRSQSYQLTEIIPSADFESRDSGVELELRSDNTSDLEKTQSSDFEQCSQKNNTRSTTSSITDDEHVEDVLRAERELLQLEQEELKRRGEDYKMQNSKVIKQIVPIRSGRSLQDVTTTMDNQPIRNNSDMNNSYSNYCQSTPDLQPRLSSAVKWPIPPAKLQHPYVEEINYNNSNQISKHALHVLSATPRSKLITMDAWIQHQVKKSSSANTSLHDCQNYKNHWMIQEAERRRLSEQRQPLRNSSNGNILNCHREIHEQHIPESVVQTLTQRLQNKLTTHDRNNILNRNELSSNRDPISGFIGSSLIDSMCSQPIHTSPTSAVSCLNQIPMPPSQSPSSRINSSSPMLSVSGKKKCSHCGDELGRGAAMIIESLCLFYHMDCFKCCVCHVQLGDGRMGTDVRVRNHKLHCHNCYSSDDGVKFSCV